jgi:hypothetical protein
VILLLAPLLVFSPFVFGGYTISQNDIGLDRSRPYGQIGVVPLADPAGSALLDEPYLVHLKRELLRARLPILNMKNGLGAPSAESLLAGTFYILNPVLLLLPTGTPFYYDLFQLLHVYIFLIGMYALLRHYVSPFAAVATGILVGLSGATFLWMNMENYRNYAWLPLMMAAAVGIAREQKLRTHALLLLFATVACGTAGNPQETLMALASTVFVYSVEFMTGARRAANAALFAACLVAATLIFSVTLLPYIVSYADGNLWATNDPGRSILRYDPIWLFSWLLPRVTGFFPYLFLHNRLYWPHSDLSTVGCFLLVVGILYGATRWETRWQRAEVALCLSIPVIIALGLIKIVHPSLLDFFQYLPLVREVLFIKYHLYLFALASIPIAIALQWATALPDTTRRRLLIFSTALIICAIAACVVYLRMRPEYSIDPNIPRQVRLMVIVKHIGVSLAVFGLTVWVLFTLPKHWQGMLLGLFVFQALAALPFGFAKRLDAYPSRFSAEAAGGKRVLIREPPNTNLFFNLETVTMFDAVVNTHYRQFMLTFFRLVSGVGIYQPMEQTLDVRNVRALQLLGTDIVSGYGTNAPAELARQNPLGFEIVDPLPRIFIVSAETYVSLYNQQCSQETIEGIVETIQRDLRGIPQPAAVRLGNGSVRFTAPQASSGVLVLNYAYSTNWSYQGRKARIFLGLWPTWPFEGPVDDVVVTYWPRGLTIGLGSALAGLVFSIAIYVVAKPRVRGAA